MSNETPVVINGREYMLHFIPDSCQECGSRGVYVDTYEDRVAPECEFYFCPECYAFYVKGRADYNTDILLDVP